jgi:hypothetical protein
MRDLQAENKEQKQAKYLAQKTQLKLVKENQELDAHWRLCRSSQSNFYYSSPFGLCIDKLYRPI